MAISVRYQHSRGQRYGSHSDHHKTDISPHFRRNVKYRLYRHCISDFVCFLVVPVSQPLPYFGQNIVVAGELTQQADFAHELEPVRRPEGRYVDRKQVGRQIYQDSPGIQL